MHRAAKKSRFLIDISSSVGLSDSETAVNVDGSLQNIIVSRLARAANSRQASRELACRLIRLAEHAFGMRDMIALHDVSQLLANLSILAAQPVGQYYKALAMSRNRQSTKALSLLETVAAEAPLAYRARAMQTLGSIYHRQGRLDEAVRIYPEAMRAASSQNGCDLLTTLLSHLEVSCIASEMGDHRGALADYESLFPLVRIVARQNPLYFYFYHNELAVEFAELGRFAEAEAACAIALNSPFASAYPEWTETRDEIAAKRQCATPSVVAVSRTSDAAASQQIQPKRKAVPVRILAFRWNARSDTFQRSLVRVAASLSNCNLGTPKSFLDRVLSGVGPRAPPRSSSVTNRKH